MPLRNLGQQAVSWYKGGTLHPQSAHNFYMCAHVETHKDTHTLFIAFFPLHYLATALVQNQTGNAGDVSILEFLWKQDAVDADVTGPMIVTCVIFCFSFSKHSTTIKLSYSMHQICFNL